VNYLIYNDNKTCASDRIQDMLSQNLSGTLAVKKTGKAGKLLSPSPHSSSLKTGHRTLTPEVSSLYLGGRNTLIFKAQHREESEQTGLAKFLQFVATRQYSSVLQSPISESEDCPLFIKRKHEMHRMSYFFQSLSSKAPMSHKT
jgi:hypothetical protein